MARFHPIKDHSTFLKSAALLQSRFPHIRFLLCGDGMTYDNAALAQMISDNHLNQRIFLLGPRSDIARLMNALDVHCLSSTSEAFPNVVGEAMACAVPCVVTDVGDSANIVGDTGYIVPPQDFQAMADACTRFVEMNAEARKDMGQRARIRIASRFDLKNMVQDYYRIYESMTRTIEPKTTYSMAT